MQFLITMLSISFYNMQYYATPGRCLTLAKLRYDKSSVRCTPNILGEFSTIAGYLPNYTEKLTN